MSVGEGKRSQRKTLDPAKLSWVADKQGFCGIFEELPSVVKNKG